MSPLETAALAVIDEVVIGIAGKGKEVKTH